MIDAVIEELKTHQTQLDQDGVMVGVSRQALEGLLAHVAAPAQPAPIAGLEPVASLLDELREYTALRYAGDCKCGNCQLVPRATLDRAIQTMAQLEAHAAEQVRVEMEKLLHAIRGKLKSDISERYARGWNNALLAACDAIRARGQV